MVILTVKDISILGDRIPKILIWELPFGKMIGGILLKATVCQINTLNRYLMSLVDLANYITFFRASWDEKFLNKPI